MSPTRIEPQSQPIELDLSGAFAVETGLSRAEFLLRSAGFAPQLKEFASEYRAGSRPNSPAGLLDEYKTNRRQGLLGRILNTAKNVRDTEDRVVLLAAPQTIQQARALFSACCHPFHNELTRGHRGGRPRIYFAPVAGENDLLQGLLDVLQNAPRDEFGEHGGGHRWTILAVDDGNRSDFTAELFAAFLDALRHASADPLKPQSALVVADDDSPLSKIAQIEELPQLSISRCEEGRNKPLLHAGVLLAASVMGMDIAKLLRGAVHAAERFVASAPGDNPAFDLAVIQQIMPDEPQSSTTVEAYVDCLRPLAEHLARKSTMHGVQSKLLIQLISEPVRFDRITVKLPGNKSKAGVYLNDLALQDANTMAEARKQIGLPTIALRIRTFDEHAIGQILQTFALAEAVAKKLPTNPSSDLEGSTE